jgi:hypothetical protein
MPTEFHVAMTGADSSDGSVDRPFRTISRAAAAAHAGDTVTVHAGTYREWVRPPRGGRSDQRRITFRAAEGEHAVIKGSEPVTEWRHVSGSVWVAEIASSVFGSFNPFSEEVEGDWVVHPSASAPRKHLGEVYLNGRSMFEATSREELDSDVSSDVIDDWTGSAARRDEAAGVGARWFAEVGEVATTIWANFQASDPRVELVEINVRRSVFYPDQHHINYLTVRGFELAHAATPWAPPTADQPGLIGPNWSKGWVIENNDIHNAKCSAISLGKEGSTGHNFATERGDKPGYQYQLESVFTARQIGWDREHIGSHVIRGNTIHDCGQNAIVGHLGCVFSTIEDNHIYNIATKREFYGYEIAGIKLHAAIDVVIRHNRIHDCSLGTWLDWQTQGTRVSRNIYYRNNRDLFIEVSHGPYVVDHNVLGSRASLEVFSQGGAFINNLVCGTVSIEPVIDRPTPYHRPHSTHIAGYAAILGGDDRYIANIFLSGHVGSAYGPTKREGQMVGYGTAAYNGHPTSMEQYLEAVGDLSRGDHERFTNVPQPVYMSRNVYAPGSAAFEGEEEPRLLADQATITIRERGDTVQIVADLPADFGADITGYVTGTELGHVRLVDADYDERDGSPMHADVDLVGIPKLADERFPAGPLSALRGGHTVIELWHDVQA